jgi:hypothetical protein
MFVLLRDPVAAARAVLRIRLGFGCVDSAEVNATLTRILNRLRASDRINEQTKYWLQFMRDDFLFRAYGDKWIGSVLWSSKGSNMPLDVWYRLACEADPLRAMYAVFTTHSIQCKFI